MTIKEDKSKMEKCYRDKSTDRVGRPTEEQRRIKTNARKKRNKISKGPKRHGRTKNQKPLIEFPFWIF